MTKKELIADLNKIYEKIENLENIELSRVLRENSKVMDDLGGIIQTLEDEDIESDEKDEE